MERAFAGDADAAQSLSVACHDRQRVRLAIDMIDADVVPAAVRPVLEHALSQTHCFEAATVYGRAAVIRWCKYAEFPLPHDLPDRVEIYRGVRDVEPAQAAKGLSWTLDFDCAAWFAVSHRQREDCGYVLKASVPRKQIVFFTSARQESEVITERRPQKFEIIYDGLHEAANRYREANRMTQLLKA